MRDIEGRGEGTRGEALPWQKKYRQAHAREIDLILFVFQLDPSISGR